MNNKRKSFTGQLFDYVLDEANFTKKNAVIFMAVLGIIAILGIYLSIGYKNTKDDLKIHTPEYYRSLLEEFGYCKMELEEMDEDKLSYLANNLIEKTSSQVAGDIHNKELSYNDSLDKKNEYYSYALANDYEYIVNDYKNLKKTNYLSEPYNKRLIKIYNDAYIINSALSDKNNIVQQKNTLENINDEVMFLSMFLESDIKVRNSVLKDRMSLTPTKGADTLKINSVNSYSMEYYAGSDLYNTDVHLDKLCNYLYEGSYILYKINFNIGINVLDAYMFKDFYDGRISIYGIYESNNSGKDGNYLTVIESEEIFSDIYNYNNSLKNENSNDNYLDENKNDEDSDLSNEDENSLNESESEDDSYVETENNIDNNVDIDETYNEYENLEP